MKSKINLLVLLATISLPYHKAIPVELPANKRTFCAHNPIFCQIVKNKPAINLDYAMELSNLINKAALELGINPNKYAAILAQESMYKLNIQNNKKKCKDYGISQINCETVEGYKFDKKRLLTDLAYSVQAGAIVLADFKKSYEKKEPDYWTRYNSSKPKHREKYKKLVSRFL